eukprot:TRINITY_DN1706_c0_g2_i1.p1 TRINITY_DN1706_c0_g2~~TRINITY_DN1706_c0_g2_i1.p1  ORF type:complete len:674 (-),score=142.88 TRINITY_DN1706_c0_g2_i1:50-1999(-)
MMPLPSESVVGEKDLVFGNADVSSSFANLSAIFKHDERGKPLAAPQEGTLRYRPLATLSFRWTRGFFQQFNATQGFLHLLFDPTSIILHRIVNRLLHIIATGMVFLTARCFNPNGSAWRSMIAALIFSFHPLNIQAINTLFGRGDLLHAIFSMIAINIWILQIVPVPSRSPSSLVSITSHTCTFMLASIAAFLSRDGDVTCLNFLLALECINTIADTISSRNNSSHHASWRFLRTILMSYWRSFLLDTLQQDTLTPMQPGLNAKMADLRKADPMTTMAIFIYQTSLLTHPYPLSIDYASEIESMESVMELRGIGDAFILIFWMSLLFMTAMGLLFRSHGRYFLVVLLMLILYPIMSNSSYAFGLLPSHRSIIDEESLYLPLIGFSILSAVVLDIIPFGGSRMFPMLMAYLIWTSRHRNQQWRDEPTLLIANFEQFPSNPKIASRLIDIYASRSDWKSARKWHYQYTMLQPERCESRYESGQLHLRMGNLKEAVLDFKLTLECSSWLNTLAISSLASTYIRMERYHLAESILDRALTIFPMGIQFMNLRGVALFRAGKFSDAYAEWFEILRRENNNDAAYHHIASGKFRESKIQESKFYLKRVLEIAPHRTDALNMLRECDRRLTASTLQTCSSNMTLRSDQRWLGPWKQ